jgi:N-carbamoyl-L-amino-acid hydrolase
MTPLTIDAERFAADLAALNAIGWDGDGGLNRTALSDAHADARRWFLARANAAGLPTRVDSAGNHSALVPAADPAARTLLLGSHLDSVPHGGRFDGALGVLCALEVVRRVHEAGLELALALEAIDFTDEEGEYLGTLGSEALTGVLTSERLAAPRGGREAMLGAFQRAGLTEAELVHARRDPHTVAGFLELHIEQGPALERSGTQIGVVTGIRGNASFTVTLTGAARHAGTTPMDARRDAGVGAAAIILGVRELVMRDFPGCVANVGDVTLQPGAFNVVPARARLALECRSLDDDELTVLADAITTVARDQAARHDLEIAIEDVGRWTPVPTDARVRAAISAAAQEHGLSHVEMPSGAGHDAQVLAEIAPVGMVFVPSVGGISHHRDEFTSLQDCVNGANVLLGAAIALARTL